MLNILEHFPLRDYGHNSGNVIHVTAEAMRRAYADRSRYLGDPDFVKVPVDKLVSKDYSRRLAGQIDRNQATPSTKVAPGLGPLSRSESNETTHFSVIDRNGNAVSNTYTLNFSFGAQIAIPGTGMLINNEMADFAAVNAVYGMAFPHEPPARETVGVAALPRGARVEVLCDPRGPWGARGTVGVPGGPWGSWSPSGSPGIPGVPGGWLARVLMEKGRRMVT